jgi:hypothetical protein
MAHRSYSPKSALFAAYPEMKELSKQANDVMEGAEERFPSANSPVATRAGRGPTSMRRNGASTAPMITRLHLMQSRA